MRVVSRQRQRYPTKSGITHTSYALYYHLVWDTIEKQPLIDDSLRGFVAGFLNQKCHDLDIHLLAMGINPDHVHLILSLKPAHYIPDVVQALKGGSSYAVNHAEPPLGTVLWKRGYCIRTVSERNLDVAKAYVNNQALHHSHSACPGQEKSQMLRELQADYEF